MTMKSVSGLLGLALLVGLLLTGCGSSDSHAEEGLRVWTTWGQDPAQIQVLFDRYGLTGGLPVHVTAGVKGDKVLKALEGAKPPDVVILSSNDPVRSYHEQGLVEPLDHWIEATGIDLEDVFPAPLAQCKAPDGTHICLPWGCDVYALFWNKDLFQAAGLDPERPPQTMEELLEYAGRLTVYDEEGEIAQLGFVPDFSRLHGNLYMRMFGGSWYDGDGTGLALHSQPVVDAVNWQRQFYSRHGSQEVTQFVSSLDRYTDSRHPRFGGRRLSCQQCHPGTLHKQNPDYAFYDAKLAMMVSAEWQVGPGFIPHAQPELHYGVAPFPPPAGHPERASIAVVEGPVAIIPAGAENKEAAAALLAWMMSPEILAEEAYTFSQLPTSRAAAEDPRFRQILNWEVFMDLLESPNAKHNISTPISAELNEALGQAEWELLRQEADPAALLGDLQAQFAPRLKAK